jgi:hypothetical protein
MLRYFAAMRQAAGGHNDTMEEAIRRVTNLKATCDAMTPTPETRKALELNDDVPFTKQVVIKEES